jgi:hypothetical protein
MIGGRFASPQFGSPRPVVGNWGRSASSPACFGTNCEFFAKRIANSRFLASGRSAAAGMRRGGARVVKQRRRCGHRSSSLIAIVDMWRYPIQPTDWLGVHFI